MALGRARTVFVSLALSTLAAGYASAQARYQLFPVIGDRSAATGISRNGFVVVGNVDSIGPGSTQLPRPCAWIDGQPHVLPPIVADPQGINNAATHVNAIGSIAGSLSYGEDFFATHAVLWRRGIPQDLGTLPGHEHSAVTGLNDKDVVVGFSGPAFYFFGDNRAFRWADGKMVELPRLAGTSDAQASDVNNKGTIVGVSGDLWNFFAPTATPVVWEEGAVTALALPAGAVHGHAQAINDSGVIGGVAGVFSSPFYSGDSRPVRWDATGRPEYLPLPTGHNTGWINSVNNRGDMVGTTGVFDVYRQSEEPALWTHGQVYRLRDVTIAPAGFEWNFASAGQINERGCIAGTGTLNGKPTGYVALPLPSSRR